MIITAYILAIMIGVSLGLIGAGGSILTVPVLVYLAGVNPLTATAYSLFIVGSTSLYGGTAALLQRKVGLRAVAVFGIPSLLTVFATRKFLLPALPGYWFTIGGLEISKSNGMLLLFALLMLFAGRSMIRSAARNEEGRPFNLPVVILSGIVAGLLAGMVGAGGGFLIIPALVLYAGMDMKSAVNTSLVIIAVNSLIGFTGDLQNGLNADWTLLLSFAALAVAGIIIGRRLARDIDGSKLKSGFGWFVLSLGLYIILKELFR